jgi:hypothetical protein
MYERKAGPLNAKIKELLKNGKLYGTVGGEVVSVAGLLL